MTDTNTPEFREAKKIVAYLPDNLKRKVREMAESSGLSISKVVTNIVDGYVRQAESPKVTKQDVMLTIAEVHVGSCSEASKIVNALMSRYEIVREVA